MGMFEGKAVLVTGAASGIGAAAAQRFAEEGAAVVVADMNRDGAETVAELIRKTGARAHAVAADVSKADDNQAMVQAAIDRFGALDAAYLNAGAYVQAPFEEETEANFERMFAINLKGAFLGLKAVLPVLSKNGAAVVTASTSGVIGLGVAAAYSSAKHGVIGLVRSSSQAFAARGTRVNGICPGPVATAILGIEGVPSIAPADMLEATPYAGMLTPQHIAELALFLASPRSGGINGQYMIADAGFLASYPPMPAAA